MTTEEICEKFRKEYDEVVASGKFTLDWHRDYLSRFYSETLASVKLSTPPNCINSNI